MLTRYIHGYIAKNRGICSVINVSTIHENTVLVSYVNTMLIIIMSFGIYVGLLTRGKGCD